MSDLTRRRTKSKYAGDEPRADELTAHLPRPKIKRHRFTPPLQKRMAKLRRKDKINEYADAANYEARLSAPWPLEKGRRAIEKGDGPERAKLRAVYRQAWWAACMTVARLTRETGYHGTGP